MWEKVEAKLIMNVLEFERYVMLALFRSTDHPVSTWCVGTRLVARKVQELEEIVRNAARSKRTGYDIERASAPFLRYRILTNLKINAVTSGILNTTDIY
jgi:hypothetical protein